MARKRNKSCTKSADESKSRRLSREFRLKKPKQMIQTLVRKIVVYEDKIEIYYNYTDETNPGDDSPRDLSYWLGSDSSVILGSNTTNPNQNEKNYPKGSDSSVMVEINGFCRNPDGAPSARRRACALARTTRDCFSSSFLLPFRRAWFSSASATQKGTLKWVPLRGGQKPYKSEPLLPFFGKVVLRRR